MFLKSLRGCGGQRPPAPKPCAKTLCQNPVPKPCAKNFVQKKRAASWAAIITVETEKPLMDAIARGALAGLDQQDFLINLVRGPRNRLFDHDHG